MIFYSSLPTLKKIVNKLGLYIEATSKYEVFTSYTVYYPIHSEWAKTCSCLVYNNNYGVPIALVDITKFNLFCSADIVFLEDPNRLIWKHPTIFMNLERNLKKSIRLCKESEREYKQKKIDKKIEQINGDFE